MASGLPVLVLNRCGCAYDLVKEGKSGFAFIPYDRQKRTSFLVSITNSKYDIQEMRQASREIINLWSPDAFAVNLSNTVKVAIGTHKKNFGFFGRPLLYTLTSCS